VHSSTTIIFCLFAAVVLGQSASAQSFSFLKAPSHARLAGLGGVNVSLADRDINFFHNNPALAGDTLNGSASVGYQFYVGDVGNALFTYAHDLGDAGQLIAGIQHTNYGNIPGFDDTGAETGEYNADETAVLVGRSHQVGHFRLGASMKGVFSNIAGYRATALLLDVGGIFMHPQQDLTVAVVFKNMGFILSDYTDGGLTNIPFDVQAGVTFKPEHMPLRFSLTAYELLESDLLSNADASEEEPSSLRKIFSHVNLGVEILLHRNVNALVGYNYLLQHALRSETGGAGGGLSFGFAVMVKPVELVFSRNSYTVANAGYSFSLLTNLNQLLRKK
jgi:hypothetical protein